MGGEGGAQVGGNIGRDRLGREAAAQFRSRLEGLGKGDTGLASLQVPPDLLADLPRQLSVYILRQAFEQFSASHRHPVLVIVIVSRRRGVVFHWL